MTEFYLKLVVILGLAVTPVLYAAFAPSTISVQRGYEGVGMDHVFNRAVLGDTAMDNQPPDPNPLPLQLDGERAANAYKNVQVLGNLSAAQFNRLMVSITQWVSPEQGCNYCHNANNMASDEKYTKWVARRMFQMTQHINENWQKHVQNVGVTCYTCHRGQPVPKYVWYQEPRNEYAYRMLGNPAQQNIAGENVTLASLPNDPFTPFLEEANNIRVVGKYPLPHKGKEKNRASIKQMEWTYSLMIHMSNSLGVNCTYCHNSRAFAEWAQSPPARSTAWYGIRMVRDINGAYTKPLLEYYPDYRKGPLGDAPKANCATCHQGAYKPLLGYNMVKDYPGLQKSTMYVPPPADPVDTDGDGVFDANDSCPDEAETMNNYRDGDGCGDEVPPQLLGVAGVVGVDFDDQGEITPISKRALDSAIKVLAQSDEVKVEVQVHSDNSGDEAAMQAMTEERANKIKAYLTSNGLAEDRVTAKGFGSTKPRASNDTEEGRAENRRVEFSLD